MPVAETGATPEQVMAAVQRRYEDSSRYHNDLPWKRLNGAITDTMADMFASEYARYLVLPTQRIVDVADLTALLEASDWSELNSDDDQALIDRIRALIGDDGD